MRQREKFKLWRINQIRAGDRVLPTAKPFSLESWMKIRRVEPSGFVSMVIGRTTNPAPTGGMISVHVIDKTSYSEFC